MSYIVPPIATIVPPSITTISPDPCLYAQWLRFVSREEVKYVLENDTPSGV
ncbi:MAG: hypothetical protein IIB38_16610 [Candidatus Hydrogenedentes bacterium]|nr:hypothetical protein [Candidatus Hydrogenedentota bacterium]